MLIVGLTGGVASGKSFVADQFKKLRIPVFDADFEVHKLLTGDPVIFEKVKNNFSKAIIDNKIDRKILGAEVFGDKNKLQNLEQIIYPQLRKKEEQFIKNCHLTKNKIAVLNIPLLFEKGGYKRCDKVIAVIASKRVRFDRFKKRFEIKNNADLQMIEQKFGHIFKSQTSDLKRKKLADFLIYNGLGKGFCCQQVSWIATNKLQTANR